MNTQQLKCFVLVAEFLNFTKAANELYLSVPTVTHHIQTLEEELNTKLFERTSRVVRLTETGKVFFPDAVEILSRMDMSQKHIQNAEADRQIFLRIGCVCRAELSRLPAPMAALQQQFPNVLPRIIIGNYFSLKKLYEDGQLDLLLVTREMAEQIRNASFHKIRSYGNVALIPESRSIEASTFSVRQADSWCLISVPPKFMPFQPDDQLQQEIILYEHTNPIIRCEDDMEAILFAQAGYGIAILPAFCLPKEITGVQALPVEHSKPMDYGFVYAGRNPYCKFFTEQYRACNPV